MIRFDDTIAFDGNEVVALGPLVENVTIKEVCAWVYRSTDDRTQDAAATEMTTSNTGVEGFRQTTSRWVLRLAQVGTLAPQEGLAFAVAVALLQDEHSQERVIWWGHPVRLVHSPDYVAATHGLPAATDPRVPLPSFRSVLDQPVA
jgi:hypothetical protein